MIVNGKEVPTELNNLDIDQTTGLEEIPTKIVRENSNVSATFLVKDIHICIRMAKFLEKPKVADINAAFITRNKHYQSVYQSVSILSILSKVCKKDFRNK